jgi:hypothetical protein
VLYFIPRRARNATSNPPAPVRRAGRRQSCSPQALAIFVVPGLKLDGVGSGHFPLLAAFFPLWLFAATVIAWMELLPYCWDGSIPALSIIYKRRVRPKAEAVVVEGTPTPEETMEELFPDGLPLPPDLEAGQGGSAGTTGGAPVVEGAGAVAGVSGGATATGPAVSLKATASGSGAEAGADPPAASVSASVSSGEGGSLAP